MKKTPPPAPEKTVASLKPSDHNPRKIDDAALAALGKALKEFGDLGGIILNVRTGRLVGGHQRVRHLEKSWPIKAAAVKDSTGTVRAGHVETPWGRLAYREVDWDERKEKAANIAANKHGGDWDLPKLKELLVALDDGSFDLLLTGFSSEELKKLIEWEDKNLTPVEAAGQPGLDKAKEITCPKCGEVFSA